MEGTCFVISFEFKRRILKYVHVHKLQACYTERHFIDLQKVKVKSLGLTKYHAIKMYWGT